jgi:hypothetical protein
MHAYARIRRSILVGIGFLPACGGATEPLGGTANGIGDAGPDVKTPVADAGGDVTPDEFATSKGVCTNPTPLVVGGQETGFVRCDEGHTHRAAVQACPTLLPRAAKCEARPGSAQGCSVDADCREKPNGACTPPGAGRGPGECVCNYGCRSDGDCEAGSVCLCGDPVGQCVPARCTSDAECGDRFCSTMIESKSCGGVVLACQSAADRCSGDAQCGANETCRSSEADRTGPRTCQADGCAIGRPFLVEDAARTADATWRFDWTSSEATYANPQVDHLTPAERRARAEHWTRIGLLEHASVAAFARFSMQLLSLGAPASLVEETTRAMQDETLHAKIAFSLASAYAGEAVGPGPLGIDGAMQPLSLEGIVRLVVREGCIGETVAALEADAAISDEPDPVIARTLSRIAEDETRHALLAWRFVKWAGARGDVDVARVLREELAALAAETSGEVRGVREEALHQVVIPCAEALFEMHGMLVDPGAGASAA